MKQRRDFIKKSIFGAGGLTIGAMGFNAKSYAAIVGANERLRVAVCGVNGRGKTHIREFSEHKDSEIVYLVDPDSHVLNERLQGLRDGSTPSNRAKGEKDVRRVLDRKEIDAISVATPNNWHSLMVVWAAQAGKHCYVEKPASHDVKEGRIALAAAQKYGIVVQHGTQRRSSDNWAKQIGEIKSRAIATGLLRL